MSADKPLETNTPAPPSGTGYRTLIPGGDPRSKPAGAAPEPAPAPTETAPTAAKPEPAKPGKTAPEAAPQPTKESPHPDPTRFGDWEVKGRCIDF